jgi:predicted DNA-binding transcriptional regulator YafY
VLCGFRRRIRFALCGGGMKTKNPTNGSRAPKADAHRCRKEGCETKNTNKKMKKSAGGDGQAATRIRGTRMMTDRENEIHKILDHAFHHPKPDRPHIPLEYFVAEFKERWNVSRRTIKRDIEEMLNKGLPIETRAGIKGGVRYTQAVSDFPNLRLSEGELALLVMGLNALGQHRGTTSERSVRTAVEKLSAVLDPSMTVNLKKLESVVTFRPGRFEAKVDLRIFDSVLRAALDQEEITFLHTKPDPDAAPTKRHVQPRHVGSVGSNWYLFADDLDRNGEWRKFALTRVQEVKRTGKKFIPKEPFDFEARMQGGIGAHGGGGKPQKIRLHFSRNVRAFVLERQWHASEKVKSLDDGAVEMTLKAPVNEELMRWIREWGAEAEVVEPAGLREAMAADAERVVALYRKA